MHPRVAGCLALCTSLLAGPGCGGGVEEGGLPRGAWSGSGALEVASIHEVLDVFPPSEGPPILGRASHLRVMGDEILVGESLDARIHRFGLGGEWRGTVGSKGEGPGEFGGISELQPMDDGTLWVGDSRNPRWTRVDREGTFQEERPSSLLARSFFPLPDGSFLVPVASGGPGTPVSLARVADPSRIPIPPAPSETIRSPDEMARWLASSGILTAMVVSGGDAWLLVRDTVYRVPGAVADLPALHASSGLDSSDKDGFLPGSPVFALPEAFGAERRAQAARNFGPSAIIQLVTGIGKWEDRGIVVQASSPLGTFGYLLEPDDQRERGLRVIRLERAHDGIFVAGIRGLQLRGDTLFAITATEVRTYRVAIP